MDSGGDSILRAESRHLGQVHQGSWGQHHAGGQGWAHGTCQHSSRLVPLHPSLLGSCNNPIITIQTTITAVICTREFPGGSDGKESTQCRRPGFVPWVRKIPWRREWQPTPVFLPGEFQGQRILVGYSPWGHKELDTTERLTFSICTRHCDNSLYPLLLLILPPPKKQ